MNQNIKYDISKPAAPISVNVIPGGSYSYSWEIKIKFAETVPNKRFVKIVWNTTTMSANDVHNHGGLIDDWSFYKDPASREAVVLPGQDSLPPSLCCIANQGILEVFLQKILPQNH